LPQKYQFDLLKKYRDILHDFRGERFRRQMEWDYEESDDDDKPSLLTGRKVWRVQRLAAELHSISFLIYKVATTTSKYFSRLVLVTLNKWSVLAICFVVILLIPIRQHAHLAIIQIKQEHRK
jgi:hypothetical protein